MSRMIMVGTGSLNRFYIGYTDMETDDVGAAVRVSSTIEIKDARILESALLQQMTPQGPAIRLANNIIPVAMHFDGATIFVKPIAVIWPEGKTEQDLELMIANCRQMETNLRAQQAGLVTANSMPDKEYPRS